MTDAEPSRTPGTVRDLFKTADDVMPVTFTGFRTHAYYKAGALRPQWTPWNWPLNDERPDAAAAADWFSAQCVVKMINGGVSGGPWVSTACDVRRPGYSVYGMTDVAVHSGHWNFEVVTRLLHENRLHGTLVGQMTDWRRPAAARYEVDYRWPDKTATVSVDMVRNKCALQFLKNVTGRLSLGCDLEYARNAGCGDGDDGRWAAERFGLAVVSKYCGPDYLMSGRVDCKTKNVRLAYYQHCNDRLQMAATLAVDAARSTAVTRLGFRVQSDVSVYRASVGTDGIVTSLWERRLGDRVSMSFSWFINHACNHGMGAGLSFE